MKTITAALCAIVVTFALPLGISQIIENKRPILFLILCLIMLPGYINSLRFLYKKYDW